MQPALTSGRTRFSGIVDTLSAGYAAINRHPWIVLAPILLDLFLWLGPQLSAARLVSQTLSQTVPLGPNGAPARLLEQAQVRDVVEAAESVNLLSGLAPGLVGVPSLMQSLGIRDPLRSVALESWGAVVTIGMGAVLGGLLLGTLFYAVLAQQVRDGATSPARLPAEALRACLRVFGYLLVLVGLGLLVGLPLMVVVAGAALVAPPLGSLAASVVMLGAVWTGIYLFFVPDAIFVSRVGPLQAIKNSVAVVRLGFWTALGIMLLMMLITLGLGQVWLLLAQRLAEPWGLGLGILGNAYVASGLVAASMVFYGERIAFLRPATQPRDIGPPERDAEAVGQP